MKQLSTAEFPDSGCSPVSETTRSATFSDSISCCGKYRECSAAMKCLNTEKVYSQRCSYRKKIEAGISFYGKNAVGFDMDEYSRYKADVSALPGNAYDCYIRLLKLFLVTRRCSPRELLYACDLIPELISTGMIDVKTAHDYVLSKYKDKSLRNLIAHSSKLKDQWDAVEKQAKLDAVSRGSKYSFKNVFIPWLKAAAPEIVESLDEKYCFVSLPSRHYLYTEEYYIDTIGYSENDIPVFVFPLQTEPVFLGVTKM